MLARNRSTSPRRSCRDGKHFEPLEPRRLLAATIETIGGFDVKWVPSGVIVTPPIASPEWLNVVNTPISLETALINAPIADQGVANVPQGTTILFEFYEESLNALDGDDLVLVDAALGSASYLVSFDPGGPSVAISAADLVPTGEVRSYFTSEPGGAQVTASVRAVGIDLSDLGFDSGTGLSGIYVTVTSPGGANLLGVGSLNGKLPLYPLNLPTVSDIALATTENTAIALSASTFDAAFSDLDGHSLREIKITSLPSHGVLRLGTTLVTLDQKIVRADVGNLTYTPDSNYAGSDAFTFTAADTFLYYAAAHATAQITVQSKAEQIDNLRSLIGALPLNHGNKNALLAKLSLKGNGGDVAKVSALIAQLDEFLANGKLTAEQANPLISGAEELLASLRAS